MTSNTHDIAARRAERDRQAALSASRRARSIWWEQQTPARCASCGAPVEAPPKPGEGLPCGH